MYLRSPVVAGTFYPDNPEELKKTIQEFLSKAVVEKLKNLPKALIVPHAGYVYSGPVAGYGFKLLEQDSFETVILLGPSHHFSFIGLASAPQGFWETPLGKVKALSKDNFQKIKDKKEIVESSEFLQPEHCLEVQLPFLQMTLKNFQIFPLLTGDIDAKTAADILMPVIDKKTLLLISSDLSHYLPYHQAKMIDKVTIDAILANDVNRFNKYGDACGKIPIEILMNIAKKKKWQPKLLCAMNSGETSGDKAQVVGYTSIAYYE